MKYTTVMGILLFVICGLVVCGLIFRVVDTISGRNDYNNKTYIQYRDRQRQDWATFEVVPGCVYSLSVQNGHVCIVEMEKSEGVGSRQIRQWNNPFKIE